MEQTKNPWKSLNYYEEGDIIYGRTEEIKKLKTYILENTQTVLFGKSGIGKTSILNAGICKEAKRNACIPVPIRLTHRVGADLCEETDMRTLCCKFYLNQIKTAVEKAANKHHLRCIINHEAIEPEREGLWEYFHRLKYVLDNDKEERQVPLIYIFDQFEEIFTLQENTLLRRQFFHQLGNLLNDVRPNYTIQSLASEDNDDEIEDDFGFNFSSLSDDEETQNYIERPNYHLVFSMREDYLCDLELDTENIPVMKENRFGLRPITISQAKEIIMKPIPGLISEEVANLIISKINGESKRDTVELALLSLNLSELFNKLGPEDKEITKELVNAESGNILAGFYHRAIAGLSPQSIEYIEKTFVNSEGHREIRSKNSVLTHLTEEELEGLKSTCLLREFQLNDKEHIELMHDKLCPVVVDSRRRRNEERARIEEEKRKEEEQRIKEEKLRKEKEEAEKNQRIAELEKKELEQRQKELENNQRDLVNRQKELQLANQDLELKREKQLFRKKVYRLATFIQFAIFIALVGFGGWHLYRYLWFSRGIITILPDQTISNHDIWKADAFILGVHDKDTLSQDTLWKGSLHKFQTELPFMIKRYTHDLSYHVYYNVNGRNDSVCSEFKMEKGTSLFDRPKGIVLSVPIAKERKIVIMDGYVVLKDGSHRPVSDAIVMYKNQVEMTDERGYFCFYRKDTIQSRSNDLQIMKSGFIISPTKNPVMGQTYKLTSTNRDEFNDHFKEIMHKLDTCKQHWMNTGGMMLLPFEKDSFELKIAAHGPHLYGYYIFHDSLYNATPEKHKKDCYYLFEGEVVDSVSFTIISMDDAFNRRIMEGHYQGYKRIGGVSTSGRVQSKYTYYIDQLDGPLSFEELFSSYERDTTEVNQQ